MLDVLGGTIPSDMRKGAYFVFVPSSFDVFTMQKLEGTWPTAHITGRQWDFSLMRFQVVIRDFSAFFSVQK